MGTLVLPLELLFFEGVLYEWPHWLKHCRLSRSVRLEWGSLALKTTKKKKKKRSDAPPRSLYLHGMVYFSLPWEIWAQHEQLLEPHSWCPSLYGYFWPATCLRCNEKSLCLLSRLGLGPKLLLSPADLEKYLRRRKRIKSSFICIGTFRTSESQQNLCVW